VNQRVQALLGAAAAELYRREGLGGVGKAEAGATKAVLQALISAVLRQNPAAGEPFRSRFAGKYGNGEAWVFQNAILQGAALRGAADLLEAEKKGWNEHGYPEDFDFEAYLSKTKEQQGMAQAYQMWAAKDPDAAAKALAEGLGTQAGWSEMSFAAAFRGRAAMAGEDQAAEWISAILANVGGEQRKDAAKMLATEEMTSGRIRSLLEHLPTDEDKILFGVAAIPSFGGGRDRGRQVIAEHAPEEIRVEIARRWLKRWSQRAADPAVATELMDQLKIPEAKRIELRE